VSITTEEPVQPPSNLTVADLSANTVTFKWTPSPAGATATSYVFEGGATPGQVLASFPVGVPSLTLAVPDGTFNVRVRSVADGLTSSASNELPIYVNVPIAPSAPSNLLATSNGHTLDLTWRNTFAGGAPTGLLLDVTGDITATLPLPMVERFSYSGVPAGNYTFAVRAANGFGTSAASNTVRRLFPDPSCLRPRAPANFRAFNAGLTVFVDWDSPTVGAAVSHYVLSVSGGLSATIPTTVRALSGNVPPGSYILRLAAVNRCGTGVTPDVSVTVP
jgi:hypothetical protein